MKKNQKLMIYGGVAILAAIVLYRYYQNKKAAAAQQQINPQDQAAADYANLAGQEQADVAALQAEIQGIGSKSSSASPLGLVAGAKPPHQPPPRPRPPRILGPAPADIIPHPNAATVELLAGLAPASRQPPPAPSNTTPTGINYLLAQPTRILTQALPPDEHSTVHQAGNSGHNGSAPAGHAVAPVSHAPKRSRMRRPAQQQT